MGETSKYTSIKQRVEHVEAQGKRPSWKPPAMAAWRSTSSRRAGRMPGLEDSLWLCPIEDRRRLDSSREGMLEGFSLGSYLVLVITRGGCFAPGRPRSRRNSRECSIGWGAVQRAGGLAWRSLPRRLFGRVFAASREKLREAAARLNAQRVSNLAGCPAP